MNFDDCTRDRYAQSQLDWKPIRLLFVVDACVRTTDQLASFEMRGMQGFHGARKPFLYGDLTLVLTHCFYYQWRSLIVEQSNQDRGQIVFLRTS